MNYLVDTHVFLWTILSPKNLSKTAIKILQDPESAKYVSVISFWEISLKFQLGKLELKGIIPENLPLIAMNTGFEILSISPDIASSFYKLPKYKNKDPFDRMLIWQAIQNNYSLLTKDSEIEGYEKSGLKRVW